jgi:hypothetical protein
MIQRKVEEISIAGRELKSQKSEISEMRIDTHEMDFLFFTILTDSASADTM